MKYGYNRHKKGSILIYALVLVTLSLTMATIMLSSSVTLGLNHTYVNIKNKLSRVISDDARVIFKLARTLNSNGGGFVDNISCPTTVSMSGSTNSGTISTQLFADDFSIYCSGTYLSQPLKIYMNSGSTDFPIAEYQGSLVNLVNVSDGKIGNQPFSDSQNTLIDFSSYNYNTSDGIDDNANSDNYSINSTGGTLYDYNFQDDDALHRKIKFGYVTPGTGFNSIFWNNTKTSNYIDRNLYNGDGVNSKIGTSSSGSLYVSINQQSIMYVYQLDKAQYDQFNEMKILSKLDGILDSGEGYIQNIGNTLSLSSEETGRSDYSFDFTTYDYAILLQNMSNEVLSYNIRGYDNNDNKDLYIVPFDDSDERLLKFLGNSVIIDEEKRLVSEQKEVVSSK